MMVVLIWGLEVIWVINSAVAGGESDFDFSKVICSYFYFDFERFGWCR